MGILLRDIRFGLRALRKAPGFTIVAVLALALGIGANTAIFSIADAFLLKPLPLPDMEHLLIIMEQAPGQSGTDVTGVSVPTLHDWQRQSKVLQDLTASEWRSVSLTGEGLPESAQAYMVEPNFFSVCGAQPLLGRAFSAEETIPGNDGVVVLSAGLWERRYAGDPRVIGQTIHVDGKPVTVIGVMPKTFRYPLATDLWVPLALDKVFLERRDLRNLFVIGRLKPNETAQHARAELNALELQLGGVYPATMRDWHVMVEPIRLWAVGNQEHNLTLVLLVAVGCALLLVCANIANLQFVRASGRVKEIAIRAAMGGSRWRIIRQLLTESTLIALAGAAFGILIARWTIRIVILNMPDDVSKTIAGWDQIQVDGRALLFTIGVAFAAGILAGLIPAMKSTRVQLSETLKESGRSNSSSRGHNRLRSLLVILQVALAIILLGGAGLLVRASRGISEAKKGFKPDSILTMIINLPDKKYATHSQMLGFFEPALARMKAIPGVVDAAATTTLPFGGLHSTRVFSIEGRPSNSAASQFTDLESISSNYLRVMGIPLIHGREFTESDVESGTLVVIISQSLAKAFWPNDDPLGHRIKFEAENSPKPFPWMTIVGVAGDVTLDWNTPGSRFILYRPQRQWPRVYSAIVVRTSGKPETIIPAVRSAVAEVDPEQTLLSIKPMTQVVKEATIDISYVTMMMSALGLLAMLIAVVGLYGVMAYVVSESRHEIGIRMALGASPANVLRMVIRRGMLLTMAGLVIGVPISLFWLHPVLGSFIGGIGKPEVIPLLASAILLAIVAMLACWIPARLATRVDPLEALRYE